MGIEGANFLFRKLTVQVSIELRDPGITRHDSSLLQLQFQIFP
jgi:hypothetical protein